uniref:Uncharacterized protein n=1 Tax=Chlamydomonas euryale TaxID=1486919 RepID=A0A7R9VX88_9CHLO|mmetsp:Transcript_6703/g.20677  ORF Transcript_6703/g.20677 Transcript_6703/m.20677 type:complete len:125 (+) Transcript_6703:318-692(+)
MANEAPGGAPAGGDPVDPESILNGAIMPAIEGLMENIEELAIAALQTANATIKLAAMQQQQMELLHELRKMRQEHRRGHEERHMELQTIAPQILGVGAIMVAFLLMPRSFPSRCLLHFHDSTCS